jgi:t-SNARE complex subunit (syntaxin)
MNNNNRRRNFRGRQQKNSFRRRNISSNHSSNGHFNSSPGNQNFRRNGSMTNPTNIEKTISKFQQLAKDAQSSGDPVLFENYLQHADHYARRLADLNFKSQSTPEKDQSQKLENTEKKTDTVKEPLSE